MRSSSTASSKRFGQTTALDDVSCEVHAGELFGFIGPDGAGKTTLFRILATLLVPDRGSATVLGQDVVRGLWSLRSRIGYMAGRFSLYGDLSVEENLRFFASVFGTTLEREHDRIAPIYSAARAVQGPSRRGALRRHETEAGAVLRARPSSGTAAARRADDRR